MNKPLVTIITPVYNCAQYIGETIESVLNQDYTNIRYLIMDDASTDGTSEAIEEKVDTCMDEGKVMLGNALASITSMAGMIDASGKYDTESLMKMGIGAVFLAVGSQQFNSDIYSYYSDENQGEHRTVNEGLKLVKGKYFMIVNADDPLLPGAVSTLVEFMESHPDVLCGYPDWQMIDSDGKIIRHYKVREYDFEWIVRHHTWLPSVGAIFRSEVIKLVGYRTTKYKWLGDAEYWLRVGLAGRMARAPYTLARWRNHGGQLSSMNSDARAAEHIKVMEAFFSTPNLPHNLVKAKSEAFCWAYLVAAALSGSLSQTIKFTLNAFISYPLVLTELRVWCSMVKKAWQRFRR